MAEGPGNELTGKTTEYGELLFNVFLHSLVLIVLAVLNVAVERVVNYFEPHGIENDIFRAVQVVFGATTLGPVIIFVVRDLWVLSIKARKMVDAARTKQ